MIDKTDFSVDIDINPAAGLKPLPDWVAFDLCKPYAVPGGNLLLHNTRSGRRAMVKPEVYATLVSCNTFQTPDTHVKNIIERQPALQGQQDDIRGVLKQMLASGIMRSSKQLTEKLKNATVPETNLDSKAVVAVITWERPQALERLLSSVAANCNTADFQCLYVIDDSRKSENIARNQALVEKFAGEFETPLHYFGQSEQQSFIKALVKKRPEHETAIRFLIDQNLWADQWTSGLARNWALLLSCGNRLVMMDDDVLCNVHNPPNPKPRISFSANPREATFFASEDEWVYLQQPINSDPVNRHLQCLGMTLSEAVGVLGSQHLKPASLQNATSLQAHELQAGSQVLITECGSLGCPGTDTNTWLPNMAPESLKKMLASPRTTTLALTTRKVWSGRNNPHFSPRSNMSQITGVDNRQWLPPYLPVLRGEDRLFGYMVDFVFPVSVVLDYPWAVPHLPIPSRDWQHNDLKFKPGTVFPCSFFEKILEHKSICHSEDPQDRLATLAAWFQDLAGAPPESLFAMHRDHTLDAGSEKLKRMEGLLASAQAAPEDWQNYLRNGIRQLNVGLDAASREDFPVSGTPNTLEGDELFTFWKDTWAGFADALSVWLDIRQTATELAAEGMND